MTSTEQPDPAEHDATDGPDGDPAPGLVEPEGTNAGSTASTGEQAAHEPAADVRSGGRPQDAPVEPDGVDDRDLTGSAPAAAEHEPGSAQAGSGQDGSGQDAGLME